MNLSVALILVEMAIQRLLTARFAMETPEKCLAFICSFTAPTFTLLIEECIVDPFWRCGWHFILHTVYRKAPSHF